MYKLIDGKQVASLIKSEIASEVLRRKSEGRKIPHLAAILVGNDGGSETYVAHKVKACEEVGFESTLIRLPESVTAGELLSTVKSLNINDSVDGFIVQLPLPAHIDEEMVTNEISPDKDVDGFHPVNLGRMMLGMPSFVSATPYGIVELLRRYGIDTAGRRCVIIGRSNIVGRPLSILLSQKGIDATVTVVHSRSEGLEKIAAEADILVAAIGKPGFVKADMVKEGAVVIDVGTTRVSSESTKSGWKLAGDVDFDSVAPKCSFITPVPGGVGPMTIVSLLRNTLLACSRK
ncbi:MAG: bifunctional 5,10-methylene-tetrahydrofolate dehydrogenase/5,10-methylene-tetrahydrofolate cyclohydrolase [Bacteroidetes bacterium]|nr:bifunctional 5,10-methylene-tetrahydrofolate dehydrogenase/5,10-methylene-tetrahydrofolate cyclohydrolase [Bacteroidota bacterium]